MFWTVNAFKKNPKRKIDLRKKVNSVFSGKKGEHFAMLHPAIHFNIRNLLKEKNSVLSVTDKASITS